MSTRLCCSRQCASSWPMTNASAASSCASWSTRVLPTMSLQPGALHAESSCAGQVHLPVPGRRAGKPGQRRFAHAAVDVEGEFEGVGVVVERVGPGEFEQFRCVDARGGLVDGALRGVRVEREGGPSAARDQGRRHDRASQETSAMPRPSRSSQHPQNYCGAMTNATGGEEPGRKNAAAGRSADHEKSARSPFFRPTGVSRSVDQLRTPAA